MIISRTPYRISFFGGGTDYPAWYRENGGQVLSTTIDKFVYISCRYLPPFFEHRIRLVYSKIEACRTIEELTHPTARQILQFLGIDGQLEIHYDGDLPARSGVGSSSAFTVGLLNALYAYNDEVVSPERLADESIHIEQDLVGEQVGSQDQVSAAYGGLNRIRFSQNGDIAVQPIVVDNNRTSQLNDLLLLFYTGIARTASDVAGSYLKDIEDKAKQLKKLSAMVDDGVNILNGSGDLDDFGLLLHESWIEKRSLSSQVSNSHIDDIYEAARTAGALGGKLTGAGGGGMLLLYVPWEFQNNVREKLSALINIPFRFEITGTQIIFNREH
jgi:D-glycero-alpha-D-manno-heptose-7-phosphate kinase